MWKKTCSSFAGGSGKISLQRQTPHGLIYNQNVTHSYNHVFPNPSPIYSSAVWFGLPRPVNPLRKQKHTTEPNCFRTNLLCMVVLLTPVVHWPTKSRVSLSQSRRCMNFKEFSNLELYVYSCLLREAKQLLQFPALSFQCFFQSSMLDMARR